MDIIAGLAAATEAFNLARTLKSIDKNVDSATYRATIAEVMNAATDVRMALVEARDLLAQKDAEIERLKAAFEIKQELVSGPGDYLYKVDQNGAKLGFPFCPRCLHVDGRAVQLVQNGIVERAKCPVCATEYHPVTAYAPPVPGEPDTLAERRAKRQGVAIRTAADRRSVV